jgi:hypothetical protein
MKIRPSTTNEPWLPKFRSCHSGPERLEGEESPHFAFAFSLALGNGNSFPRVDIRTYIAPTSTASIVRLSASSTTELAKVSYNPVFLQGRGSLTKASPTCPS